MSENITPEPGNDVELDDLGLESCRLGRPASGLQLRPDRARRGHRLKPRRSIGWTHTPGVRPSGSPQPTRGTPNTPASSTPPVKHSARPGGKPRPGNDLQHLPPRTRRTARRGPMPGNRERGHGLTMTVIHDAECCQEWETGQASTPARTESFRQAAARWGTAWPGKPQHPRLTQDYRPRQRTPERPRRLGRPPTKPARSRTRTRSRGQLTA